MGRPLIAYWVVPRDGMGKASHLFTAGWELDGKVGSHLDDWTGWEYTISWWDGIGEWVGKSVGNVGQKNTLAIGRGYMGSTSRLVQGRKQQNVKGVERRDP